MCINSVQYVFIQYTLYVVYTWVVRSALFIVDDGGGGRWGGEDIAVQSGCLRSMIKLFHLGREGNAGLEPSH